MPPTRRRPQPQPQQPEPVVPAIQEPPQQGGSDEERERLSFNEDLTREQLLEIATNLQLDNNTQKRQLTEVTRHRDELVTAQRRKRRRPVQDEPTPQDHKYELAGKRCALFWMLWVSKDLYDVEVDNSYTEARRYANDEPVMQTQGDRRDVLASVPEGLAQGFTDEEHFQRVFDRSLGEQRRTSASRVRNNGSIVFGCVQDKMKDVTKRSSDPEFKRLLGFNADEETSSRRYPPLAPVLYADDDQHNPKKAFRSEYIKKTFRVYLFGPTSVHGKSHVGGAQVLAEVIGAKTITAGAIAAAATLTRWAISPDPEFKEVGPTTGIQWKSDYQQYKKLILESLHGEKQRFNRTGDIGPYSQLIDEWNLEFFPSTREDDPDLRQENAESGDAPDIMDALAQSQAFANGD